MQKHFYILLLFFTCMQAYGQGMYYVKDTVTAKTNVPDTKILDKLSDKAVVTFRDAPAAKYAFDTYNSVYDKALQIKSSYEHIGSYHVNNKAILPNEKDIVEASIQINDAGIKPEEIAFVTDKGNKFEHSYDKGIYTVTILGGGANDGQRLYAVYKNADGTYESLGKLNIYSYAPKTINLSIVPVGTAQARHSKSEITDYLNKIYGKIGITVNITIEDAFDNTAWDLDRDGKLKTDQTGLFDSYSDEMKALNKAFSSSGRWQKDRLYLFVLNEADKAGVGGDMPRGEQFGYLFKGYTPRTVAHEIGHGVFKLQHTFNKTYQIAQGSTNNLMDYSDGSDLIKHQWDIVHKPGIVFGIWEGDDEGMLVRDNCFDNQENYKKFKTVWESLFKDPTFLKVFNIVNNDKQITYCFSELKDNEYKGTAPLAQTSPLAIDETALKIKFINRKNAKQINLEEYYELTKQLSQPENEWNGMIDVNMSKLNKKTLFHELNHAAQFLLMKKNNVPYTFVQMEVETRLILYYSIFISASEDVIKNRNKMYYHLINLLGEDNFSDLLPLTGDFRCGDDKEWPVLSEDNSKLYSYIELNNIFYHWFKSDLRGKEKEENDKKFDFIMKIYAKFFKECGKESSLYKWDPQSYTPNYHLFNLIRK